MEGIVSRRLDNHHRRNRWYRVLIDPMAIELNWLSFADRHVYRRGSSDLLSRPLPVECSGGFQAGARGRPRPDQWLASAPGGLIAGRLVIVAATQRNHELVIDLLSHCPALPKAEVWVSEGRRPQTRQVFRT
jgi:hypothetical protein